LVYAKMILCDNCLCKTCLTNVRKFAKVKILFVFIKTVVVKKLKQLQMAY